MKAYTTLTGTYSEEELSVIVWLNPNKGSAGHARRLETISSKRSSLPMAFPTELLLSSRGWSSSFKVTDENSALYLLPKSSRTQPVIMTLPMARNLLGWEDFYIASDYTER